MISKSVDRAQALHAIARAVARHGETHTATAAAHGRAFVVWEGRHRPPRTIQGGTLAHAYTTAQLRAYGQAGYDNRRWRAHEHAKAAAFIRSTLDLSEILKRKLPPDWNSGQP